MKVRYKLGCMIKLRGEDPRGFLVGAFIACPSYEVQQFACFATFVNFGVENLGDFKLGFTVNDNGSRWRLDLVRNGIGRGWLQHRSVKNGVDSSHVIW